MPLINKSAVEYGFERPPNRFDIIIVVSDIGFVHVRPIPDAVGHAFPFRLVLPNALLAFLDKRLHAVFFYVLFAVDIERLFHFQLDGQTVRIPARFAQNVLAFHGVEPRNNILHSARQNMPDVRFAVSRGRTVIERKFLAALACGDALIKDVVLFPELDNVFFHCHGIVAVYLLIHNSSH